MDTAAVHTNVLPLLLSSLRRRKGAVVAFLIALAAIVAGLLVVYLGLDSLPSILLAAVALPAAYVIVAHPNIGIIILLVLAYIIMFFTRLSDTFPLGTVMDAVEAMLVFSFLLRKKYDKGWAIFKNGISVILLVWIGYNFLQIINPVAASRMAWLYTIRTIAIVALTYFIFIYYIRDVQFIRLLLKVWITLSFIAAVYTFVQEFVDFAPFEKEWLASDPAYTSLYYIGNHWRKFSIFSDPVALAYNMVISSVLCFALTTGPFSTAKKILLGLLGCFFFTAMLYSGTRGAFVLIPITAFLFGVLKFNRRVLIIGTVIGVLGAGAILMPTSNGTLYRFQTAFKPSEDASVNVRNYNQQRIQPYILTHPMGGGLGATGTWGQRFSPGTMLSNFPPDSGYVRVAVEAGWIGLLIFCTLMFIILKTGIRNYFSIRNKELKAYCLAMLLIIFALNIGNYPQEALVQYPINIYFYLAVALIPITMRLDKQQSLRAASENQIHLRHAA